MGFFMKSILDKTITKLKLNLQLSIIFGAIYVLGIILGAIFSTRNLCNNFFKVTINNYYVLIFDTSSSVFKPFLNCVLTGFLLTLFVSLLGFSKFTTYLSSILLFYKGIVLGTSLIFFYSLSSIYGIIIFIILTLPTNLILTLGLIVSNVLNFTIKPSCDTKTKINKILSNATLSLAFTLIASFYATFLLITVIRPINLLF